MSLKDFKLTQESEISHQFDFINIVSTSKNEEFLFFSGKDRNQQFTFILTYDIRKNSLMGKTFKNIIKIWL